ncbi:helix-turn-helix domain-containing protein [Sphingomonas cavernae]|uniref:IclR family transcriptional regulator n=1 Tax=Sphingomonas cavernae TaxID=2320861 RepID=A0A418WMH6_9SPHN|nr:helix-turn-helix domain-containing protein [Sphingomonas cavernae]RJF91197.1 IclR family transcriptional regulator [Sphingomonas cavernae]
MGLVESNKAKIAKRVIEVLEFFDDEHPQATVMDIVRRFDRPQSSTSELLSSLVDLGLLYKDPCSRSYSPTPRAAMLGCSTQPGMIRDGRLTGLIDRLSAQTGLGVAVFGMVGLKTQIYSWRAGTRTVRTSGSAGFCGGQQEHLSDCAAGWLLLSTVAQPRRDGMIRRLNAEASPERKFAFADMAACVQQCREVGHASGVAGFGSIADATAILLPGLPENQPLAVGFVYEPSEQIDPSTLLRSLTDAVARCVDEQNAAPASVQPLFHAARHPQLEKKHG